MLAFLFLLAAVVFAEESTLETLVWVDSTTVNRSDLLPAGGEQVDSGPQYPLYAGRAEYEGHILPGKVLWAEGANAFRFFTAVDGEEIIINYYDIEILMAVTATTSWVRSTGELPIHPVDGGTDPITNEKTFICRAFILDHLLIGRMIPSSGLCEVTLYHGYSVRTFEVLVKNDYAIYTELHQK